MEEAEQQHPPAIDWRAFWTLLQRSNPPKWLIGFALLISLVETVAELAAFLLYLFQIILPFSSLGPLFHEHAEGYGSNRASHCLIAARRGGYAGQAPAPCHRAGDFA